MLGHAHVRREGAVHLPVPPGRAFPFFTPEGERAWIGGWDPEYLHPPGGVLGRGLVFRTRHGGEETIWMVTRHDAERHEIEYLRDTPGSRIGTVTVRCEPAQAGGARVHIVYALTALSDAGGRVLEAFSAAAFDAMLAEWESSLVALLR